MFHKGHLKTAYIAAFVALCTLCACSGNASSDIGVVSIKEAATTVTGKPNVLVPTSPNNKTEGNDYFKLDYSNSSEGYVVAHYIGSSKKTKLQLTGPNNVTYTYNLTPGRETVIPLSTGDGTYTVNLFESLGNDQFATSFSTVIDVNIANVFSPFLYPNEYVNFSADSEAVEKAEDLASNATCELEIIGTVYSFLADNITYDYDEAKNVASDYIPVVDEVLDTKKGICFDYASLMASMLRSQGIPTKLEIGYAKDAYHAWISVYTKDTGWIDKIMQFDGKTWTLMDPTLAANSNNKSKIKEFVGDGTSYSVKYTY